MSAEANCGKIVRKTNNDKSIFLFLIVFNLMLLVCFIS